ncbi:MAG: hypothetical protein IJC63_07575 [Myxococcaceae bacterium]|nr:hypothetical protein [Myxococcaceae bacterium]
MADLPTSELQEARKALFKKGKRQGYLTFQEISAAIPEDMMSPAERWLLFYSLRAMGIQLLDVDVDVSFKAPLRPKSTRGKRRGDEWDEADESEDAGAGDEGGERYEDRDDSHPPI